MGSVLLLIILIIMFFFVYNYFEGVISPSVQLTGMFIVGTAFYISCMVNWHTDISIQTICVIIIGFVLFYFGEDFAGKVQIKKSKDSYSRYCMLSIETEALQNYDYGIKPFVYIVCTALSIATLYFYYQYSMKLAAAAGNKYGIAYMINFVYYAKNHLSNMPEASFYLTLGIVISRCFAYYCIFLTILSSMKRKLFKSWNFIYVFPILIYLAQSLLAGGRTELMRFMIQYLVTFFVLQGAYYNKSKPSVKVFGKIFIGMVIFLLAYRAYGLMRGSQHAEVSDILSYPGSPLQALNMYLDSPKFAQNFGETTLGTVRTILRKLGFDTPVYPLALPSVYWTNGGTNIYTAFYRYIYDYGFVVTGLIMLLLGIFYGALKKWQYQKRTIDALIIYASMLYPVIEFLFEERFFIGILNAGTVYTIIIILLLRHIVVLSPSNK